MKRIINKYLWVLVAVVVAVGAYFLVGDWIGQRLVLKDVYPSPNPVQSASTYTELVKKYNGKRIQFDKYCQANPSNVTFKNGTSIMLDNRSGDARIVSVGGVKYSLAGYGYKVITLSSTSLPKELLLSCGSSGNVGKILLQAQILQ